MPPRPAQRPAARVTRSQQVRRPGRARLRGQGHGRLKGPAAAYPERMPRLRVRTTRPRGATEEEANCTKKVNHGHRHPHEK